MKLEHKVRVKETYDGQRHETAQDARLHIAQEEIKATLEESHGDPISFVVKNASKIYAILQWVFQPDHTVGVLHKPHWSPIKEYDEHPKYLQADWRNRVADGCTTLGYIDWVNQRLSN